LLPPLLKIILNKLNGEMPCSLGTFVAVHSRTSSGRAGVSADVKKVVIIHGGKARGFAAGADITEFERILCDRRKCRRSLAR